MYTELNLRFELSNVKSEFSRKVKVRLIKHYSLLNLKANVAISVSLAISQLKARSGEIKKGRKNE
jgi:hypothetical protein